MKTIITLVKLTPEEREVLINISADENGKLWAEVDTTIQKYANILLNIIVQFFCNNPNVFYIRIVIWHSNEFTP